MTQPSVVVVDYNAGNLLSVYRAFAYLGAEVVVTSDPDIARQADRLVLPGVGAFGDCISNLTKLGLDAAVHDFVRTGRPMLGICVGMQMLFDGSEEFGVNAGLGLIPGRVLAIPRTRVDGSPHKIPHIGWAEIERPDSAGEERWEGTVLEGLPEGTFLYFVHSFTGHPETPTHRLADIRYGGNLVSAAVQRDNIIGVQFHPEKSGEAGLHLLKRFLMEQAGP